MADTLTEEVMTEATEEIDAAFDEAWGDDPVAETDGDDFDGADANEEPAAESGSTEDQPAEATTEAEDKQAETEPAAKEEVDADHIENGFVLKHMDDPERTINSRKEATELMQKGIDYDRIRAERDALKADRHPEWKEAFDFLNEIKGEHTVEDLMEDTRAHILMGKEKNLSLDEAKSRLRAEKAQAQAKAETDSRNMTQEQRSSAIREFVNAYPNVDPKTIGEATWREFNATHNLKGAYERQLATEKAASQAKELEELRTRLATLEQNEKNKARSTDSRKSEGQGKGNKDDFDSAFDNF